LFAVSRITQDVSSVPQTLTAPSHPHRGRRLRRDLESSIPHYTAWPVAFMRLEKLRCWLVAQPPVHVDPLLLAVRFFDDVHQLVWGENSCRD